MKKFLLGISVVLTLIGCNISAKPINYGSDGCHYCSMTIVDKQHAAEFVTKKGRSYVFDASECMLNHLKEIDSTTVALFFVNDYNTPGELIDATQATYLISKNIPSPMGAFLSAFATKEEAEYALSKSHGKIFTWKELLNHFN